MILSRQAVSCVNTQRNILKSTLDAYFHQTQFNFPKEGLVDQLRRWMELVYLRDRPLVSIDVEAWERKLTKVTEIGIAIYDPTGQLNLLIPRIKTVHIVSAENKRLRNGQFVPDNKTRFNGGVSYEMDMLELRQFLKTVLSHYLNDKNGVLVGHNLLGDIDWLAQHGVKLTKGIDTVDTGKIYNLSRKTGGTLRGLLRTAGIPHLNLHNAANDAYYTLLAAMSYCDPEHRRIFGLDVYFEEASPSTKSKQEKREEKFNENAYVVLGSALPAAERFIDPSFCLADSIEVEKERRKIEGQNTTQTSILDEQKTRKRKHKSKKNEFTKAQDTNQNIW